MFINHPYKWSSIGYIHRYTNISDKPRQAVDTNVVFTINLHSNDFTFFLGCFTEWFPQEMLHKFLQLSINMSSDGIHENSFHPGHQEL